jgi:hypothetical protein
MRLLGLLLFLFGIGTIAVYFLELDVEWLAWIDTWGEGAAWLIRWVPAALGLILLRAGGKKKDGKNK